MEVLRNVIVVVHLIGFAMTAGALLEGAIRKRFEFNSTMHIGIVVSLITGVVLSAPFGDFDPLYPKLITKLVLLVVRGGVLGMGSAQQKKTGTPVPPALYWSAIGLSIAIAAVAVLWTR